MALIDLGGVLYEESVVGSGTGNYNSFLRLQNKPGEEGFNTDDPQEADNKDGIWTHSMLVSSFVVVVIDGVEYYEVRLDLNEGNAEGDPPITLEELRLFYSAAPADGDDFDDDFIGLTEVFNLTGSLALTDINTGSGTDDYRFLIRADLFPDKNAYFTLYSQFSGTDGGFEEWRSLSQDVGDGLPVIHIEKDVVPTSINEGTPTAVLYTYTLTNLSPGDDALLLTSFIDDFATPLNPADDIDLLAGIDATHPLGIYYVSGDLDFDGLLDTTETWIFQAPRTGVVLDATDTMTNVAAVNAIDEEGNNTTDSDDATITAVDVLPAINIDKIASPTQIQAGVLSSVTFTYSITNTSTTTLDPITLTELVDDNGTPLNLADDVNLLTGAVGTDLGDYYVSGDDGDALLETGETWIFEYTTDVTLLPGQSRTNVVSVTGEDDEGNSVGDTDDAIVTAFNLGRTPGFWSNNGSLLWDGNTSTFPKAGGLGIVDPGEDLAYAIFDLNGDGVVDNAGSRQYLMIGDWNTNGIADANENVLVISRANALSLLNASDKLQQDGRYTLSRDMVASWLNYLGGSFVGDSDDPNSAMHYLDEATAWLIETTSDHNHVLTVSELSAGTKVAQNGSAWQEGFDYDGDLVKGENMVPAAGQHDIGLGTTLDILGGSAIHTGLDHYNNFGFI